MLSALQIKDFHEKGYLVVENLVTANFRNILRNYVHNFYCLPLLHDLAGKEGKGDAMDSFLMGQPLFPKGFDKVPEKVMTRKIEKQVLKRIRGRVQWVTEYRTINL